MKLTVVGGIGLAVALGGCSTVVNGSNQSVNISTGAVTEAKCLATGGSKGAVRKNFETPADVRFPRSSKVIDITCEKDGYHAASTSISGKVEGTTAGNVAIGGPTGLGVDALTGAVYKYPDTVLIEMEPLDPVAGTAEPLP